MNIHGDMVNLFKAFLPSEDKRKQMLEKSLN
jgi:hypothetical protein